MKYKILGTVQIVHNGSISSLSAPKIETVLATLLIRFGQVVSIDQLINEIWGFNPPRRATATLHVYVSQLRKMLRNLGNQSSAIVTKQPGYLFQLGSDEFDLQIFLGLVQQGRSHMRERAYDKAVTVWEDALSLCHSPALGGQYDGPIINGFITWLHETRLECIEMQISSKLGIGRHYETIGTLRSLISEYPLHEAFYQQLMIALYRCGRRGDALNVYQAARDTLRRDLGLEPGRALEDMQHAILTADEKIDSPAGVGHATLATGSRF